MKQDGSWIAGEKMSASSVARGHPYLVTEEEVLEELNKTADPELGIGIVDLGLVANCQISGDYVRIAIRTTTPRCPFQPFIMMEAHRKLLNLNGVKGAEVEISNETPWHPEMMTNNARDRLGFLPSRLEASGKQVPEIRVGLPTE